MTVDSVSVVEPPVPPTSRFERAAPPASSPEFAYNILRPPTRSALRPRGLRRGDQITDGGDGGLVIRNGRLYDPAWDAWEPRRRWPQVTVVLVAMVLGITALVFHQGSAPPTRTFKLGTGVAVSPSYFPLGSPSGVQSFTGTKSSASVGFVTQGNMQIAQFGCFCKTNFALQIYDAGNQLTAVPVNAVGNTALSTLLTLRPGAYHFVVTADGPWNIRIMPAGNAPMFPAYAHYLSRGDSAVGPIPGTVNKVVISYLAPDDQTIHVEAWSVNGAYLGPVVNGPGMTNGSFSVPRHSGNFYFLVTVGSGNWQLLW